MTKDNVTLEKDGRIAIVRFDRGNKANAMSYGLMEALTDVARTVDRDPDLSAVVLTGRADTFTLGFDLKDPASKEVAQAGLADRRHRLRIGRDMCQAWTALEPLTIVAVEGWCVGGGVALSMACDLRIASEDAIFYAAEVERGMNMSWGSVPRIVSHVGPARAKRLVVMAERVAADTALDWGLVDAVVPRGTTLEAALERARHVATLPPVAVRMCKQGIERAAHPLAEAVSAMDRDQFALAQGSEDYEEAVKAFIENREPQYKGR